jgi:hypothetical protein
METAAAAAKTKASARTQNLYKSITGTPYAGVEQYGEYCEPTQARQAAVRMQQSKRSFGAVMTGIQPAVGGKMTGDEKGCSLKPRSDTERLQRSAG